MKGRTTQVLLLAVGVLLVAHLFLLARELRSAESQKTRQAPSVLRAQAIELVNRQGRVVAQLHVGEDGGGNLRLRNSDGVVRVKLGATAEGAGLLLLDREVEPAVKLATNKSGTSLTLAEKGKESRVITP